MSKIDEGCAGYVLLSSVISDYLELSRLGGNDYAQRQLRDWLVALEDCERVMRLARLPSNIKLELLPCRQSCIDFRRGEP